MSHHNDLVQSNDVIGDVADMGLIAWIDLVIKHRVMVMIMTGLFSGFAAFWSMTAPNIYSSQAQVLVEKLEKSGDTIRQNQELLLPSMSADEDYLNTQALIMTSGRIVDRAVDALGMNRPINYETPSMRNSAPFMPWNGRPVYKIEAFRAKTSRVIRLQVRGPNADLCQMLASKVIEVYLIENARENMFASRQMYAWLTSESGTELTPEQVKKNEDMVSSLESIVADPELQRLEAEKLKVITNLREMSLKYRPRHPKIRDMANSLDQISRDVLLRKELLTNNLRSTLKGESHISNVRLLDPALLSEVPIGPHRILDWMTATLLGFVFGAVFILVREKLNRTIRTENDMPKHLGLSCLGSIPRTGNPSKEVSDRVAGGYCKLLMENLELRDSVVSIRTHILFSLPFEKSRCIMFAGATPDKEESTAAILTALSIAGMNRNILLVDVDVRHPQIHSSLGLDQGKGLAEYLSGDASLEEVIRVVPGSTLKVIAGGVPTMNSSSLLASVRFDELMGKLTQLFDRVILNVPPILYIPDAMIVAKNVSCAVLVCSSGVTKKESVNSAVTKFIAMNRPLMGYVINQSARDKDLRGQSQKDYRDYKNNYLKMQPYPFSQKLKNGPNFSDLESQKRSRSRTPEWKAFFHPPNPPASRASA
jgi:capsular exopolysaccharide synthesis family protein